MMWLINIFIFTQVISPTALLPELSVATVPWEEVERPAPTC